MRGLEEGERGTKERKERERETETFSSYHTVTHAVGCRIDIT